MDTHTHTQCPYWCNLNCIPFFLWIYNTYLNPSAIIVELWAFSVTSIAYMLPSPLDFKFIFVSPVVPQPMALYAISCVEYVCANNLLFLLWKICMDSIVAYLLSLLLPWHSVLQSFFPAMTKIVGTPGPKSGSVEILEACLKAGMSGNYCIINIILNFWPLWNGCNVIFPYYRGDTYIINCVMRRLLFYVNYFHCFYSCSIWFLVRIGGLSSGNFGKSEEGCEED